MNIDEYGGKEDYQKEVLETIDYIKNAVTTVYVVVGLDKPKNGNLKYVTCTNNYSSALIYVKNTFGRHWYECGVRILEKEID